MTTAALPPSLSHLQPYLARADELKAMSPLVAHALRLFVMMLGIKEAAADAKSFLMVLMDTLEEEKNILKSVNAGSSKIDASEALQTLAMDLLSRAKAADQPDMDQVVGAPRVARALHAAAVLLDAMRQYAPLTAELAEAQTYAHKRSKELAKSLALLHSTTAGMQHKEPCVPLNWSPVKEAALPPKKAPSTKNLTIAAQKPAAAAAPPPAPSAAPPPQKPPADNKPLLPAGWESRIDPASGKTFYVNLVTKTTAWELPAASAAAKAEPQQRAASPPPADPPPRVSSLPEGWEARIDPGSGKTFYVNLVEKTTSWEKPLAGAPRPSTPRSGYANEVARASDALRDGGAAAEAEDSMQSLSTESLTQEADEIARNTEKITAEADRVAAEALEGPPGMAATTAELEAMWSIMSVDVTERLKEREEQKSEAEEEVKKMVIQPPPEGASREEVKAYRAAIRAAAVENITRIKGEAAAQVRAAKKIEARRRAEAEAEGK